jgi:hypothetical protein
VFREFSRTGTYVQKVRCTRGHWRRYHDDRLEATYLLHTLLRRVVQDCPDYASTSEDDADRTQYLDALVEDLPAEKLVFRPDGSLAMGGR